MFHSAQLRLTLVYSGAITLVMVAFSIALYLTLAAATSGSLDVGGNAGPGLEDAVLAAQLSRARLVLLGVNIGGSVLAAGASYFVAGRTLKPIERAVKSQRQFTAHASHELRTPLTVIKGEIDVTRARRRSSDEYERALDKVDTEVQQLERAVSDLLALAGLEAGAVNYRWEKRDLREVMVELLRPLGVLAKERGLGLVIDASPGIEVVLDWPRIRHLLTNLVDNAIQHASDAGRIRVRAHRAGRHIELSVFNTGAPIPAGDLDHVFVPFYRGKGSRSESGTGLGLALCDWIVRQHHGSIGVENGGGGVLFTVRLPVRSG